MNNSASIWTGIGTGVAGAALAYLFDPGRGRRRRARVRDFAAHRTNAAADAVTTTVRDAANRAQGTAAALGRAIRHDAADDRVLLERVRSVIGRVVSHPHAIDVAVDDGVVMLCGPVLKSETKALVSAVSRVRGVRNVINKLEQHKSAARVPALQGGGNRPGLRPDVLQQQWSPTTRLFGGVTGALLLGYGVTRRDAAGALIASGGAGLAACAATNFGVRRITGVGAGRRAVDIQKTINVAAPLEDVFEFWSAYENFPRFMANVRDVRQTGPGRSHWTVSGPAGSTVEFDALLTEFVPDRLIAWKTAEGSAVGHAGIVRFDRNSDGTTRIHIRMSYNPPAGSLGHAVAALFGADPKTQMDADLARMKTLLETGNPPHDAARKDAGLSSLYGDTMQ